MGYGAKRVGTMSQQMQAKMMVAIGLRHGKISRQGTRDVPCFQLPGLHCGVTLSLTHCRKAEGKKAWNPLLLYHTDVPQPMGTKTRGRHVYMGQNLLHQEGTASFYSMCPFTKVPFCPYLLAHSKGEWKYCSSQKIIGN